MEQQHLLEMQTCQPTLDLPNRNLHINKILSGVHKCSSLRRSLLSIGAEPWGEPVHPAPNTLSQG